MKRWLIVFTVGCLALAGAANAAVQQGDTELDLAGGWVQTNGERSTADVDEWFIDAGLGYFLSDNVQVSAIVSGSWLDADGVNTDAYGVGAGAKYHFMPTNQLVPYIGFDILYTFVDDDILGDIDGVAWGPNAGVRYELNAYNDFFVEYQYTTYDGDVGDILKDRHAVIFGIVHQFK